MKNMMAIVIIAVLYALYVLLGVYKQFAIGYVDWIDPYLHFETLGGSEIMQALALPCVVFALAGLGWYRKSMMGDP
jgi:hypothetical protein